MKKRFESCLTYMVTTDRATNTRVRARTGYRPLSAWVREAFEYSLQHPQESLYPHLRVSREDRVRLGFSLGSDMLSAIDADCLRGPIAGAPKARWMVSAILRYLDHLDAMEAA